MGAELISQAYMLYSILKGIFLFIGLHINKAGNQNNVSCVLKV